MEEVKVTTTETVDKVETAPENTQTEEPKKTVDFDEHQKKMTSQYKAGMAAAMKEAGFEPEKGEDFKAQMSAFRQWQESQKTEAERAADALRQKEAELENERQNTKALKHRFAAVEKGIPSNLVDEYVAMAKAKVDANPEIEFADALDSVIAKIPYKSDTPKITAPTSAGQSHGIEDEFAKRMAKYTKGV